MDNKYYFEKYKQAREALCILIVQFFSDTISSGVADELNIDAYTYNNILDNSVEVCFHGYDSIALHAWEIIGIEKPFISYDELFDKLSKEQIMDIDYRSKYLEAAIVVTEIVLNHYSRKMSETEAKKYNVKYDRYLDAFDGEVSVCDHFFESAGEHAWHLFDIKDVIVGNSVFQKLGDNCKDELLNDYRQKIKKLGGK